MGRLARASGQTLAVLAIAVALIEVGLQLAAAFVADRESSWREGARVRVLCVGDSHAFGAGVEPEESLPSRLQAELDRREPQVYSVVNYGVPGFNTAQVRQRLPEQIARLEPDVVLVWAGVNNVWNHTAEDDEPAAWTSWLDAQLLTLRTYRLVRVRIHDAKLERSTAAARAAALRPGQEVTMEEGVSTRRTIEWAHGVEEVEIVRESRSFEAAQSRAALDYAEIARFARQSRVEPVLIAYPGTIGPFAPANRALREIAIRDRIPLVETEPAVKRLKPSQRTFLWAMHPTALMYREIGIDVADAVVALSPTAP